MDNLGAQKASAVRRAFGAAQVACRYLPACSPDLSPT
jgi:hypothetical protein